MPPPVVDIWLPTPTITNDEPVQPPPLGCTAHSPGVGYVLPGGLCSICNLPRAYVTAADMDFIYRDERRQTYEFDQVRFGGRAFGSEDGPRGPSGPPMGPIGTTIMFSLDSGVARFGDRVSLLPPILHSLADEAKECLRLTQEIHDQVVGPKKTYWEWVREPAL